MREFQSLPIRHHDRVWSPGITVSTNNKKQVFFFASWVSTVELRNTNPPNCQRASSSSLLRLSVGLLVSLMGVNPEEHFLSSSVQICKRQTSDTEEQASSSMCSRFGAFLTSDATDRSLTSGLFEMSNFRSIFPKDSDCKSVLIILSVAIPSR